MRSFIFGGATFLLSFAAGQSGRCVRLLVVLGIALAIAWVLFAYFSANPSDQRPDCSDCGVYLGRWGEPGFVLFMVGANPVAWIAGVLPVPSSTHCCDRVCASELAERNRVQHRASTTAARPSSTRARASPALGAVRLRLL